MYAMQRREQVENELAALAVKAPPASAAK